MSLDRETKIKLVGGASFAIIVILLLLINLGGKEGSDSDMKQAAKDTAPENTDGPFAGEIDLTEEETNELVTANEKKFNKTFNRTGEQAAIDPSKKEQSRDQFKKEFERGSDVSMVAPGVPVPKNPKGAPVGGAIPSDSVRTANEDGQARIPFAPNAKGGAVGIGGGAIPTLKTPGIDAPTAGGSLTPGFGGGSGSKGGSKSGQPGSLGPSSKTQGKTQIAKAPKPADECFKVKYKHKKLTSHKDGIACTHHQNLLVLPDKAVNSKSVCVRVNGKPVKYKRIKNKRNYIVVGSVAGPRSTITASYCTGGLTCKDPCKIPKDEFMAAIGGSDDGFDEELPMVHWSQDGKAKKNGVDNVLDKELSGLKSELAGIEESHSKSKNIFKGWIRGEKAKSCKRRVADKGSKARKKRKLAKL